MGRSIHRNGDRYREWSSICDQYATAPMTRAEMAAHLAETTDSRRDATPARIEERLARADAQGTSAHGDTRDATTWDTERCDGCGSFHHAFTPQHGDANCANCGESQDDTAHSAPCVLPEESPTASPPEADGPAAPQWQDLGAADAATDWTEGATLVRYEVYSLVSETHRTELAGLSDADHAAAVGAMGVAYLEAWRRLGGVLFE